jgi:peptidoglycan/xylan/chitin deacetylase (PgdA/CDA1 family)
MHRTAALLALLSLSACALDTSEEDPVSSQGEEIISEHQLVGNELPNKTIALTFDDGPGERTSELAEYLDAKNIHATFFINGYHVPGRQKALASVIANGHIIGNHTQHHLQLTSLSSAHVIDEVKETDAIIAKVQPKGPWLFRAPFGAMNGSVVRAMNGSAEKKYVGSVFWDEGGELTSNSAADWACWGKHVSVARCGELYLQEIRRRGRGIVLMHDIHNPTIDMVKTVIVPTLIKEGWHFAKLTDVPSIKRSLAGKGGNPEPNGCESATLGRSVPEKTCVQAKSDEKWHICKAGEWVTIAAPNATCVKKYPLD